MATNLLAQLTILEQMKRVDADGSNLLQIAEVLHEYNEFMMDAPMFESNQILSNVEAVRDKLPTISPRRVNEGVTKTVSAVKQITDSIMLLDDLIEIDEEIIDHQPDRRGARMQEIQAHLEALMQTFSQNVVYGSEGTDVRTMNGVFTRFNDSSLVNVEDSGGSGSDLTSILMLEWGPRTAKLIYPRGSKSVGVYEEDLGKQRVTDTNGNPYRAYCNQVKMEFGISIPDSRAAQRIANIESTGTTNNLNATGGMYPLIRAKNRLPRMGRNAIIYVNRDLKSQFDIWALDKTNVFFALRELGDGTSLTTFQGIPIRMVEQILSTETAI